LDNIFRFARFEADREGYQLRHDSRKIKLERIPLELLFLLLEHAGKLVPRAQAATRLWGDGVYLDTERSINTAILKLRKALGDDPHHPQFIETIVGKGYRFIAPVVRKSVIENPLLENDAQPPKVGNGTKEESTEIRLRDFIVEATGGAPVLMCYVTVGSMALGRLPLFELEFPTEVTLPLKSAERFPLKLHGMRVTLTAKAAEVLHAFSISVLQSGLLTRVTDSLCLNEESDERPYPAAQSNTELRLRVTDPPVLAVKSSVEITDTLS
jgi:DNA-binding winged helix-turn-helix (wHTH) protein